MTEFDDSLRARLHDAANPVDDSDWDEVRRRARRFRVAPHRPLVLVAALVVVALSVGATVAGTLLQAPPRIPGPRQADRALPLGSIGWLFRHEPRGRSLGDAGISVSQVTGARWQPLRFARVLRPAPGGPLQVVAALIGKRGLNVCVTTFDNRHALDGGCGVGRALRGFDGALLVRGRKVLFSGLASDGVARMTLFVTGGKPVDVPLRDNAFAIQVPLARFPANLVAYDAAGRVVQIDPWRRPRVS